MPDVLFIDIEGAIINKSLMDGSYITLPGTFESIQELKNKKFGNNIFIISNANTIDDRFQVIDWLSRREFYARTGVPIHKLFFCSRESEKADICEKKNATHFIGGHKEAMIYMRRVGVKNLFIFQGKKEEGEEGVYDFILPDVVQVESWLEIKKALLK